jgi:hypothetical protein
VSKPTLDWKNFISLMSDKLDKQVISEGYYSTDTGEGLGYWNSLLLNALVNEITIGNLVLTNNNKQDLLELIECSYADSDRDYSLNEQTKIFIKEVSDVNVK